MNFKAHLFSNLPQCMPRLAGVRASFPRTGGVYLTFDDGPHPSATAAVLASLEREKLHATFFMTGDAIRRAPGLAREVVGAGHGGGNHAMRHRRMRGLTREEILAELRDCNDLVRACGWPEPVYFRPPHGWYGSLLAASVRSLGMEILLWNRMPCDYDPRVTLGDIRRYLRGRLRPGDVIVLHDNDRTAHRAAEVVSLVAELLDAAGLRAEPLPSARKGTAGD